LLGSTLIHIPVDLVCCAGGIKNILYAFGLGYGFSMMANSSMKLLQHGPALVDAAAQGGYHSAAGLALTGGALYFVYGARLCWFLGRRQMSASYQPKLDEVQEKSENMPLVARFGISAFVALSQALYSMPLQLACTAGLKEGLPPPMMLAWGALGLSALGLGLEAVADEQKLSAKATDPSLPVTTGLYSLCRHPNYSGEILFHLGMWGLGAQASALEQGVAMLAPGFMMWVMVGAARRLDKGGAEKYADSAKYKDWVGRTPSLFPGATMYVLEGALLFMFCSIAFTRQSFKPGASSSTV